MDSAQGASRAEQAMQSYFDQLVAQTAGLRAALVTDREGVSVVRAAEASWENLGMEGSFAATFALAAEQTHRLRLGANSSITCFFDNCCLLHTSVGATLIVTLVGEEECNVGLFREALPAMRQFLAPVAEALVGLSTPAGDGE